MPALALAADKDPQRKINPADERKAASIVFKKTDFAAGWKRTTTPSDDENVGCAFYDADGSGLTLTGDAEAEFERTGGFPSVLSYADIYATSTDTAASAAGAPKPGTSRSRRLRASPPPTCVHSQRCSRSG